MEYKNVHIIYFSPTHTSAKTAYAIAEGLSGDVLLESDITYDAPAEELEIHDDELTIVAAPVYGGRVAETAMERLRAFHAHQAPVVPVVVYGNRDYGCVEGIVRHVSRCRFCPCFGRCFCGRAFFQP